MLVGGKDRRRRAELGAHVGDDVPVHRGQAVETGAVILDDPADASVHAVAAQHLEDDVLGADPVGQPPVSRTPEIRGIVTWNGSPAMASATSRPPAPMASIAERPGRRRVTVGAEQRLARHAETLHV